MSRSRSTHRRAAGRSRRDFLQALGAAGTIPLLPAWSAAQTAAPAPPPAAPAPAPEPPPQPAGDPQIDAEAIALAGIVHQRFGTRLQSGDLDAIRDDLAGGLRSGRALRALKLSNADEPDTVFFAGEPEA